MNNPILIYDSQLAQELLEHRSKCNADKFDEVWSGVYVISPMVNNEHQELTSELVAVLRVVVDWNDFGKTLAGANISDRQQDWQQNYRVPDILVFSKSPAARDEGTHWQGGPELAIEIVSIGDRTYEKLDFYAAVGTQELIVIDRHPWKLTLYRLSDHGRLEPTAISTLDAPKAITSKIFPIEFQLCADPARIVISSNQQIIRKVPIAIP